MDPKNIADGIIAVIEQQEAFLRNIPADRLTGKRNRQDRCIKQLLGHLIDSASNNHQRIVRLQYNAALDFPDYTQDNDLWIALQDYAHEEWETLVQLWKYYNIHLAHIIKSVDTSTLDNSWRDFEGNRVTLREMIKRYPEHLLLHIDEIHELA